MRLARPSRARRRLVWVTRCGWGNHRDARDESRARALAVWFWFDLLLAGGRGSGWVGTPACLGPARRGSGTARRFRGIPLSASPFHRPSTVDFRIGSFDFCVRRNRPLGPSRFGVRSCPDGMDPARFVRRCFLLCRAPAPRLFGERARGVLGFTAGGVSWARGWMDGWTGEGGDARPWRAMIGH
jgi:hypothetical protein